MKFEVGHRVFVELVNSPISNKFVTGEITELYVDNDKNMALVYLDNQGISVPVISVNRDCLTKVDNNE